MPVYRDPAYGEPTWMRVLRALSASFRLGNFFRVALATSSATLVLSFGLSLVGAGLPSCSGLLVWPAVMVALTFVGVSGELPGAQAAAEAETED